MEDSADLIRRARNGEDGALDALLAPARPVLRQALKRQMGQGVLRTTSIDDLEQEILLALRDLVSRLREGATLDDFLALLQQHARWAVGKAARKRQSFDGESAVIESKGGMPELPAPDASMGPVTLDDERTWLLERIAALDPPQAAVVSARMKGRTFGQIAAQLDIGEDAARKRYAVAAAELARAANKRRARE